MYFAIRISSLLHLVSLRRVQLWCWHNKMCFSHQYTQTNYWVTYRKLYDDLVIEVFIWKGGKHFSKQDVMQNFWRDISAGPLFTRVLTNQKQEFPSAPWPWVQTLWRLACIDQLEARFTHWSKNVDIPLCTKRQEVLKCKRFGDIQLIGMYVQVSFNHI